MPTFLLIEDGEEFTIESSSMKQAREDAVVWNAEVIKELKEEDDEGT